MLSRGKLMVSLAKQNKDVKIPPFENNSHALSLPSAANQLERPFLENNTNAVSSIPTPANQLEMQFPPKSDLVMQQSDLLKIMECDSESLPPNMTIVSNVEFDILDISEDTEICTMNNSYAEGTKTISSYEAQSAVTHKSVIMNDPVEIQQNAEYFEQQPEENVSSSLQNKQNSPAQISDVSDNGLPLVPYSEHSSSESESDLPKKSTTRKKRSQVRKQEWFSEKNKKRRERGLSYYGRIKVHGKWAYENLKEPRFMKERCKCKRDEKSALKCSSVSESARKKIFNQFWKQLTWEEKKVYINQIVTVFPTGRHRDRKNAEQSRREQSVIYNLLIDDINVRVCRTMFLNTLCIGRWTVLKWKDSFKDKEPGELGTSNNKESAKPFKKQNQDLGEFLDSMPVMESHYCRSSSNKKYLLPEWSSKRSLYHFYMDDWCKSRNIVPLSRTSFNEAFQQRNLALFMPKKDECEKCAGYKVGAVSESEYELHISKKEEARLEKERDKSEQSFVFTADMQAVLMAPKSQISSLYYRTKLQVHNMCFYNLNYHDGFSFIWNESEGGVNSDEFASIWTYFLKELVLPKIQQEKENRLIIIYTDGCSFQNRNVVLANALLNLAVLEGLTIVQKYLEVGHTQMEADSMHSTIEKSLRKKVINVPAEYIKYVRNARRNPKPYEVIYLDHTFFKKFNEVMVYKSIRPGRAKGDSKVTDIRALKYTSGGDIFYKERFSDDWSLLPQRKTNVVNRQSEELQRLHENRLPIKLSKYEDLQHIKRTLLKDYHEFYDNLPFK